MARLREQDPKTAEQRGAALSIAWRASANRTRRRVALVVARHPDAGRFDELARRAIGARFGRLDRRLHHEGPGLSAAEADELARLEATADELRGATR